MALTGPIILIVEDEEAIAELLSVNLRYHGFTPVWASTAEAAIARLEQSRPAAVLLDWMLPTISGLMLLKQLRQSSAGKEVPILMVTARVDEADRLQGLEAGADDYILKPFSPQEVIARIRAVLRRSSREVSGEILAVGGLKLDPNSHRVWFNQIEIHLAPTEYRLLLIMLAAPQRVFPREVLLDKVWSSQTEVEIRTVDVHIKRLRANLGEAAALIQTVRGAGYRLSDG
jgi:two-component system, OmpR family, phosphate regulon response regulator PhoB